MRSIPQESLKRKGFAIENNPENSLFAEQYELSKCPVNVPKTVRLTNGLTHGGAGDTAASNSGSRAREGPGPSRRSLVPSKGNPWSLP